MSIGGLAGTLLAGLSQGPQQYQQAQEAQRRRQALDLALQETRRKNTIQNILGGIDPATLSSLFGGAGGLPGGLPSPAAPPPQPPMPGQASVPAQPGGQSQFDPALAVQNEVNAAPTPMPSLPPRPINAAPTPAPMPQAGPGGTAIPPPLSTDRGQGAQIDPGAPIEREQLPPPQGASEMPAPGGQGAAETAPQPVQQYANAAVQSGAVNVTPQGHATIQLGGQHVDVAGLFRQVDPGKILEAVRKARPDADPAATWGATVELFKMLQGDKTSQIAASAQLKYLMEGARIEARHQDVATQQTGATERTGMQQAGAGARSQATRDAAMAKMLGREGRIDARAALRAADQNARAALVAGDKETARQIQAIRAQIAQIAAKNPGMTPNEADQKRLDALGKQLADMAPPAPAPAQPQQ